jgi:hypothetical protein
MRRKAVARFGAALLATTAAIVSCSNDSDDPVSRACKVVVQQCGAMDNMSDCLDVVGDLSPPCVACIGSGGCDYFSECQRNDPNCVLPPKLKP